MKAVGTSSVNIQILKDLEFPKDKEFSWELQTGPEGDGSANFMSKNGAVLLQINPRPESSIIVLNTMESDGQWGQEQIIPYARNFFRVNVTNAG